MSIMNLLFITSVLALIAAASAAKNVFCYYGTWANYRSGNGKFTPANIKSNLCTHIGYSFFGVTAAGAVTSLDTWLDYSLGYIQSTEDLRNTNPNVKILAVVGGYNQGSTTFSAIAADANKRQTFVDSALAFVQQNGFDGLDLDWEYPALNGGSPIDKSNFVTLLQQLSSKFRANNKLLTIAVGATSNLAAPSYNIPAIHQYLDFINLMTYDMYGSWNSNTGENAPLYNPSGEYSADSAVNYWINQGAPASKLNLGLAFYGRSFTLASAGNNGIGAPAIGGGTAGPFTQESGYLGYNEICLDKTWNVVWDNNQRVPYAYKGNQWVGYDNVQSITEKANYALSKNLGGVMIWSIETDDFRGDCGAGQYPLLNAAYSTVNGNGGGGSVNPPPVNPPPVNPAPVNPPPVSGNDTCQGKSDGFYRSSTNCVNFYQCAGGLKYNFNCSSGLVFNNLSKSCDYPSNVQC